MFRDDEGCLSFSLCAISMGLGQTLFDIGLRKTLKFFQAADRGFLLPARTNLRIANVKCRDVQSVAYGHTAALIGIWEDTDCI